MARISRRAFLGFAAAAANFGGKSYEKLIPYVIPPENIEPGEWAIFATGCRECPAGCGMLLRHRDGRVTKAEGIPDHPVSRGGLCPRGQSALQGLYDPDRLTRALFRKNRGQGAPVPWSQALGGIARLLGAPGGRVAVISQLETGSLAELLQEFAGAFGSGRLLFYEPFDYEPLRQAHQAVLGKPVIPRYDLRGCDSIISFGADFLEGWVSNVELASQFSDMHAYRDGRVGDFTYVGPRLSMTAANADEFFQVAPGLETPFAVAMLMAMREEGWTKHDLGFLDGVLQKIDLRPLYQAVPEAKVKEAARAFSQAKASVALAGPTGGSGPSARNLAAAAALLNAAAGRLGKTVDFSHPHALSHTATRDELDRFLDSLGPRDVLLILEANPVFSRPETAERLARAGTILFAGTMFNETAVLADWVLPLHSPYESWGDYDPYPFVHNLLQPAMAPLYDTRSAGDLLLALARAAGKPISRNGRQPADFGEWVQERWRDVHRQAKPAGGFEPFWRQALQRGGFWKEPTGKGGPPPPVAAKNPFTEPLAPSWPREAIELWAWPHIMLFDGRVANRGWLQENPEPVSYLVWGSWIDLHPRTAGKLGIENGDVLELKSPAGAIRAPARVTDDVVEGTAAIPFGQGHWQLGRTAAGVGANPFQLLAPGQESCFARVSVRKTGEHGQVVRAAATSNQHGRNLLQWEGLATANRAKPGGDKLILPLPEGYRKDRDLYPPHEYKKHRWAMVVDIQRCIGCGACAVACYAENNIPVMGREQLEKGRELAWLRVVPYEHEERPRKIGWLPMLCQHCDAAPCEPVCPVFAAVHTEEGLNAQIYNRCIGTRYCNNNCPYKVRRFNWLNTLWREPLQWQLNPEVTVRCRGVMEKCTFCVQRIRQAEYQALREDRPIRDGEIQPACVQSCPAKVYTFGDLLDPKAEVTRLTRQDPRRYHVLEKLNTKPAVTYLRRIEKTVGGKG